jgi:hypothetical protein
MLLNLGVSSAVSMTSPLSVGITEALDVRRRRRREERQQGQGQGQGQQQWQGQGQGQGEGEGQGEGRHDGGPSHPSAADATTSTTSTTASASSFATVVAPPSVGAASPSAPSPLIGEGSPARWPRLPTLVLHAAGFATGLVYVTRAGVHWVSLADHYIPLYLTVVVGLSECLIVSTRLGCRALLCGMAPSDQRFAWWWRLCWQFLIPPVLAVLLVVQIVSELSSPFGAAQDEAGSDALAVVYPPWALGIGWLLSLGPTLLGPICWACGAMARRRARRRRESGAQPSAAMRAVTRGAREHRHRRGGGGGNPMRGKKLPPEHAASIDVELRTV